MTINKEISIDNIVTWAIIVLGFVGGFVKLQGDVGIAKQTAEGSAARAAAVAEQVVEVKIAIARVEERAKSIESKVDEIRRSQKTVNLDSQ